MLLPATFIDGYSRKLPVFTRYYKVVGGAGAEAYALGEFWTVRLADGAVGPMLIKKTK